MAKRFRNSQLELRRGDQCDKEIGHERLPWRGPALVRALSDGAEQREDRISDAAQDTTARAARGHASIREPSTHEPAEDVFGAGTERNYRHDIRG